MDSAPIGGHGRCGSPVSCTLYAKSFPNHHACESGFGFGLMVTGEGGKPSAASSSPIVCTKGQTAAAAAASSSSIYCTW